MSSLGSPKGLTEEEEDGGTADAGAPTTAAGVDEIGCCGVGGLLSLPLLLLLLLLSSVGVVAVTAAAAVAATGAGGGTGPDPRGGAGTRPATLLSSSNSV